MQRTESPQKKGETVMYKKKTKKSMGKVCKALLIMLVCGLTLAAFAGIVIFLAEFTGWYIVCIGAMIATITAEARGIWNL